MEENNIALRFSQMDDKIRNRIDLFICEEAIKLFGTKSKFKTFSHWANKLQLEISSNSNPKIESGWISKESIEIQVELIERITDIFGFNADEGYYLVQYFFINKLYLEFEAVAKQSCNMFYKSIDKTFNY
jgi:hypothetical protein